MCTWGGGGEEREKGEFEPELKILSSDTHVFYILIWRCLKVKSSLLEGDGLEGNLWWLLLPFKKE